MASIDVTVRGAGVFGLACAWQLIRRGARVQVVDPAGAGAGASGGVLGALAPHVPEGWNPKKAFQLDSLLMSEGYWRAVEAKAGLSTGYGRLGRLQPLADAAAVALARQRAAGAAQLWGGAADWRVVLAEGRAWAPPSPTGLLVEDTLSARLHPRRAVAALVAALAARGLRVQAEAEDRGAVLWASGVAGLAALSADLGRPVGTGVKGQAALLRYDAGAVPQLFAGGLHIVPHVDGTVAVGSADSRDGTDPGATDAALEALVARARALVPALAEAPVIERWAALRPRARSRAPMLGPWPGRPGHFVANGGFKIGFGIAPKVAEVMADLILEGRDHIPPGLRVEDN